MSALVEQVRPAMGTVVAIRVAGHESAETTDAIARAFEWFARVEATCSRFDPASELSLLVRRGAAATPVSPMLFDALAFALEVAAASDGAFDPTVGAAMVARGADRDWRSGAVVVASPTDATASWRDLELDRDQRTVRLARPLALDLGAVAKGLAIDLAARELAPLGDYAIDAGGDLYLAGSPSAGSAWTVGIRHPREPGALIGRVAVHDRAVCTSGDYERLMRDGASHLHDPRTALPVSRVASATVVAPQAMVADALATAAAVLGPAEGIAFLSAQRVEGLIVTPSNERHATPGWSGLLAAA